MQLPSPGALEPHVLQQERPECHIRDPAQLRTVISNKTFWVDGQPPGSCQCPLTLSLGVGNCLDQNMNRHVTLMRASKPPADTSPMLTIWPFRSPVITNIISA